MSSEGGGQRLFLAVDLDEAARSAIAEEQARLRSRAGDTPIRWVKPEQMHMTLVFMGHLEATRASAARAAFSETVPRIPFEVVFGGLGVFPPHGAPRALWIGALAGGAELVALQRELANRATEIGIALERRRFSPHLTIARWKTSRSSDRRRLLAGADSRPLARVRIDHATLYHSRLSSAGSTYTPVARADLALGIG